MIAYVRGWLDGPPDTQEVSIRTTGGPIRARAYAPSAGLTDGTDVVAASAVLAVGVVDHELTALLGPWPTDHPDPGGPLGLASTPVIVLMATSTIDVALAGVTRAGRSPAVARFEASTPHLGLAILAAASEAEVIVVTGADGRLVDLVRILGGRAVVALPTSDPVGVRAWARGAELGADIPVPTTDEHAAGVIASLGLEATHQLVQVDPGPALEEAGVQGADASPAVLAAAAAGVLAGRIGAGNRRWRAALEP
jgi:hypothetical protein